MKVRLSPGETLSVEFEETDGSVDVSFSSKGIEVKSDMTDDAGRRGVLYAESFGDDDDVVMSVEEKNA